MGNFYIDQRSLEHGESVSWDIARYMFTRYREGQMVVVAENSVVMLSSVRKQWQRVVRQALRERSSTLNPKRIMELSQTIAHMQTLKFAAQGTLKQFPKDVLFTTLAEATFAPPACNTLYITCGITKEELRAITSAMTTRGVVVVYNA